jgi:probable F420-dependent oxidoreductase
MKHPLRIGLKLARDAPIETFRRFWKIADDAGFEHCWAFDHLAVHGPGGSDGQVFDGWSLLAGMAAATRRTRIGLLVTGIVYRHPALLAKTAVTVDHLSNGRLEFGIGAGWATVEQQMFDIDIDHRVGRLSEGLQVMKMLWTQERSDFEGRYYRLHGAVANPKPIQQPHPPIWIGADGPAMLRIAAQHANVWNPAAEGFAASTTAGQRLIAACREVGRDPAEIRWSTQLSFDGSEPAGLVSELGRWHQAGFTELVIYCQTADPIRAAEIAAEKVLSAARQLG